MPEISLLPIAFRLLRFRAFHMTWKSEARDSVAVLLPKLDWRRKEREIPLTASALAGRLGCRRLLDSLCKLRRAHPAVY